MVFKFTPVFRARLVADACQAQYGAPEHEDGYYDVALYLHDAGEIDLATATVEDAAAAVADHMSGPDL
jgi:hypothetical protein